MPVFVIETTHELVLTSSMAVIRPGDTLYCTQPPPHGGDQAVMPTPRGRRRPPSHQGGGAPGDKSIYLIENGKANPVTSQALHDRLDANARSMVTQEYKNAYAERIAINEKDADRLTSGTVSGSAA